MDNALLYGFLGNNHHFCGAACLSEKTLWRSTSFNLEYGGSGPFHLSVARKGQKVLPVPTKLAREATITTFSHIFKIFD